MKEDILSLYCNAIGLSIGELAEKISQVAQSSSNNPTVLHRIKDIDILLRKIELKHVRSVFEIDDVYGFRILVSNTDEVYAVLLAVQGAYSGYVDHDYIETPKTRPDKPHLDGKSLRLVQYIAYLNGVTFEIQITTNQFNKENEKLHKEYHLEKYTQNP